MSTGNFPWTLSVSPVSPASFDATLDSAVASLKLTGGPDGGPMPTAQTYGLDAAVSGAKLLAAALKSNTTVGATLSGSTRPTDTTGPGPYLVNLSVFRG